MAFQMVLEHSFDEWIVTYLMIKIGFCKNIDMNGYNSEKSSNFAK
jgi:hypothetical protein